MIGALNQFVTYAGEYPYDGFGLLPSDPPVLPVSIEITLPGVTEFSATGVPAGVDVTCAVYGAGAGGGGFSGTTNGGGGGGGGGYCVVIFYAEAWAEDGTITIGTAGAGGGGDGVNGGDSSDTLFEFPGGIFGFSGAAGGQSVSGVGRYGGAFNSEGEGFEVVTSRDGGTGGDGTAGAGGAGGYSGAAGGSDGGAGSGTTGVPGTAGQAARVVLSFYPPASDPPA